ncbi:MAG TPA: hypothetical protein VN918_12450, partial [Myxococcaceae bacterium]|nr:hypothetical protein [Myxococcaceae bacterium]
ITKAIRKYYYGEETGLPKSPAKGVATSRKPVGEPENLIARIERLEQAFRPLKEQIYQPLTNPHFAALTSRVEKLEQFTAQHLVALSALVDLLVEKGVIHRTDYAQAMKRRSKT